MFETTRSRLLTVGLLALGVTPAALLAAAVVHVGFCHVDPHAQETTDEPFCCEVIEITAHGHHHTGADAEHDHPAAFKRGAAVTADGFASLPSSQVALPGDPLSRAAPAPREHPPPTPLFLATHALLL